MALILVDGFADVRELKRKIGDAIMLESALGELENLGLIETLEAHTARMSGDADVPVLTEAVVPQAMPPAATPERIDSPVEKPAGAEPATPIATTPAPSPPKVAPPLAAMAPDLQLPEQAAASPQAVVETAPPKAEPPSLMQRLGWHATRKPKSTAKVVKPSAVFGAEDDEPIDMGSAPDIPPMPDFGKFTREAPPAKPGLFARLGAWWSRRTPQPARTEPEPLSTTGHWLAETPPATAAADGADVASPTPMPQEPVVPQKPMVEQSPIYLPPAATTDGKAITVRRGPRYRWTLWTGVAATAFIVAVSALLLLFLFPYDGYRPDYERRLSELVGDPVTIGEARVSFLPVPTITLDNVSVGDDGYATIGAIRLLPTSLLGAVAYKQVWIDDMRIAERGLPRLSRWLSAASMGDLSPDSIDIRRLAVDLRRGVVDGLSGKAIVEPGRGLARVELYSRDNSLRIEVSPTANGVALAMTANRWKSPTLPPLTFDALDLRGELSPGRFAIGRFDGRLHDGLIEASGYLAWDKQPLAAIEVGFQRLAAGKLLREIEGEPLVDGEASGKLSINATAPSLHRLSEAPRLEGRFIVSQGAIRHMDLVEGLKTQPLRGGSTAFEEFTGTLSADGNQVRLANLRLAAGLMRASGQATITRKAGTISARTRVEMRGSANSIATNLAIVGKAADPELRGAE